MDLLLANYQGCEYGAYLYVFMIYNVNLTVTVVITDIPVVWIVFVLPDIVEIYR